MVAVYPSLEVVITPIFVVDCDCKPGLQDECSDKSEQLSDTEVDDIVPPLHTSLPLVVVASPPSFVRRPATVGCGSRMFIFDECNFISLQVLAEIDKRLKAAMGRRLEVNINNSESALQSDDSSSKPGHSFWSNHDGSDNTDDMPDLEDDHVLHRHFQLFEFQARGFPHYHHVDFCGGFEEID